MKNDIYRDDCCVNCSDRTRACWGSCPAHKARLDRADAKRKAIEASRREDDYWRCITLKSFGTIR